MITTAPKIDTTRGACGNIRQSNGLLARAVSFIKSRKALKFALNMAVLALLAFMALGCAEKIEYKEVLIPQKCEVSAKIRPIYKGEVVEDLRQTLVYTELLEQDLQICRGENNETGAK